MALVMVVKTVENWVELMDCQWAAVTDGMKVGMKESKMAVQLDMTLAMRRGSISAATMAVQLAETTDG